MPILTALRLTSLVRSFAFDFGTLRAISLGSDGRFFEFSNNYRDFFSDADSKLSALLDFQATYTKSDKIFACLIPETSHHQ